MEKVKINGFRKRCSVQGSTDGIGKERWQIVLLIELRSPQQ